MSNASNISNAFFLIATPTDSSYIEVESSNEKIERGYRPSWKT
jgi:hypothetical protein